MRRVATFLYSFFRLQLHFGCVCCTVAFFFPPKSLDSTMLCEEQTVNTFLYVTLLADDWGKTYWTSHDSFGHISYVFWSHQVFRVFRTSGVIRPWLVQVALWPTDYLACLSACLMQPVQNRSLCKSSCNWCYWCLLNTAGCIWISPHK